MTSPPTQRCPAGGPPGAETAALLSTSPTQATTPPRQRDGAELKAEGMDAAEAATDPWWASCVDQAIETAASDGYEFTAFDLIERFGLAEPDNPHHWGPRFRIAAQQGLIEPAGYAPNRRPTARKNIVRVWKGVTP